jgi:putative membrane protein insertion efficiency factor
MKYVLVFLITLYQRLVSPWLPPSCRYTPSCSQYAREALLKHGLFRGLLLAAKRLARCHPFHAGGYDPVP